jgi:uncharacterized repeat protein (TIGR03843 family)
VLGRLVGSSNNAMVVRVHPPGTTLPVGAPELAGPPTIEATDLLAVWKPTLGERPLFDFPLGTLTRREVAAYLVSEALGWSIVPPTLLREGPYGEGMIQRWIDVDPAVDVVALVTRDDPRLRRIAVFDAAINNTDRKGGHLLPIPGGHLYAVDHGVTFSTVPKLRTLLWAWEGDPFEAEEIAGLRRLAAALDDAAPASLGGQLRTLLDADEVDATRQRVASLLADGRFPGPNPEWPAIPWPPF